MQLITAVLPKQSNGHCQFLGSPAHRELQAEIASRCGAWTAPHLPGIRLAVLGPLPFTLNAMGTTYSHCGLYAHCSLHLHSFSKTDLGTHPLKNYFP